MWWFQLVPALPPDPGIPRALQTLKWIWKPIPFLQAGARAYGDAFTVHPLGAPLLVFFSQPFVIKETAGLNPILPIVSRYLQAPTRTGALPHIADWGQCGQDQISAWRHCPTMSSCMAESTLITVA
jgi:hypothetical protein